MATTGTSGSPIPIGEFASELAKQMQLYSAEVERGVAEAVVETAKETRDVLKASSPFRKGAYRKGWRVKVEDIGRAKRAIVHNKWYQLVHLVEKGHATRSGGRTRAQPHVAPAEGLAKSQLEHRIRKVVEGR